MRHVRITIDRTTRTLLLGIAALLAVIAVELWDAAPSALPTAAAQVPDTGKQRQDLILEQRRTNELLTQVLEHIRTKPIKVEIAPTDKSRGDIGAPRRN